MSRAIYLLTRAFSMPPREVFGKLRTKSRARIRNIRKRRKDLRACTFLETPAKTITLAHLIAPIDLTALDTHREAIAELTQRTLNHEFDLLGSGWTKVINTRGLEVSDANRLESQRIADLLPADYTPIDWHVDFKSGHRWDPQVWYRDQPQIVGRGIDVKTPWELARMQHLPQLAWSYAIAKHDQGMPREASHYLSEFRNEILDFIAHNPPRFGINWNCTMDVAIRCAGWLLTFDLFTVLGAEFDDEFMAVFTRSLVEHRNHIAGNLEWDDNIRSNHYLADIAGLLIVSAYLPADTTTDAYLRFAARELIAETRRQFHEDGSNFEASTSYHRLSGEMVVYALAALQGVTAERFDALTSCDWSAIRPGQSSAVLQQVAGSAFDTTQEHEANPLCVIPDDVIDRLARMARFTEDILDRHGRDPQIGDNDNGRFFKLMPATTRDEKGIQHEDMRNHRHLIDAVNGFFEHDRLGGSLALPVETLVVYSLLNGVAFTRPSLPAFTNHIAYPGMGLYLYKHGRMTTIVRCGEIGQNGNGGHAHDDQMSFVMYVDGEPVIIDPGTGCYTSEIELRHTMRRAEMHNTTTVDDLGTLSFSSGIAGLFQSRQQGQVTTFDISSTTITCRHTAYALPTERTFRFSPNQLEVTEKIGTQGALTSWFHMPVRSIFEEGQFPLTFTTNGIRLQLNDPTSLKETLTSRLTQKPQSNHFGHYAYEGIGVSLLFRPQNKREYQWSLKLLEDSP